MYERKSLAILMLLVILNSIFTSATCSAAVSIDKQLEKRGFPKSVINILSDEVKVEILNHDGSRFAGSDTYVCTMEEQSNQNISGDFTLSSTISSSDLSFTSTYATWINNGEKYLYVIASYDWINMPFWRLTDEIGITWDSTKFQVVDGNYAFHMTSVMFGVPGEYVSYDARELNAANIIGDIELSSNSDDAYGYATILLKLKSGVTAPSNTQIFYKYGHAMVLPTVSLAIDSSGLGISISGSINVASLAKASTINLFW